MRRAATRTLRRAGIAIALGVVLSSAVAIGAYFLPDALPPASARLRMIRAGQPCEAVDLELDFDKRTAKARPWSKVGERCEAVPVSLPFDEGRSTKLQGAASRAAAPGFLRAIAMGEPYDGTMTLDTRRGAKESTRTLEGRKTEGVADLEAFFAVVVKMGTRAPEGAESQAPGGSRGPLDLRRVDLQDLVGPAATDAQRRLPGAWLSHVSVDDLLRGGEIDASKQQLILTFASGSGGATYVSFGGRLEHVASSDEREPRPSTTSRCSSRDLWRKAIASGMPDTPSAQLWLYVGNRMSGGWGPTWTLIPAGVADRSKRRVFDGSTCEIVQP